MEEDTPSIANKVMKVCGSCNVEEAIVEFGRVCQGCEEHVLGTIGYSAIVG